MSHITDVKLKIRDLDALAEAARACGLELREGQRQHKWYGTFVGDTTPPAGRDPRDYGKCEHALALSDATAGDYEVGVVKALDGDGFTLLVDTWNQRRLLQAVGGPRMDKLRREYACAVASKRARQKLGPKGWRLQREDLPSGRIRLRVRR